MDLGVSLYRKENWAEATMVLQYNPAVLVSLFPESEARMISSCIEVTACFYLCIDQYCMWVTHGADVRVDKGFLLLNLLLKLCRWGSPRTWITKCSLKEGIDYKSQCPPHRRHFMRRPGFPSLTLSCH